MSPMAAAGAASFAASFAAESAAVRRRYRGFGGFACF
jgi:hypothetical protein